MSYNNPNSKPTIKQLNYLKILSYTGKIPETKSQTSLLIADLLYHWRPQEPTQKQISYLKKLGHKGSIPKTRGKVSDLISNILHQKKIDYIKYHYEFLSGMLGEYYLETLTSLLISFLLTFESFLICSIIFSS